MEFLKNVRPEYISGITEFLGERYTISTFHISNSYVQANERVLNLCVVYVIENIVL